MLKKFTYLLLFVFFAVSCSNFSTNPPEIGDEDNSNTPDDPGNSGPNINSPADIFRQVYVLNGTGETISLIDLNTGIVQNDIFTTGAVPSDIYYKQDNLYIVNSGDNTIQIIDTQSGVSNVIELGDNRNPSHLELYGDNMGAVSNWVSGTVSFIDFSTNTVVAEVSVGAGLWGIAFDEGKIFTGITNYDPGSWSYGQGYAAILDASSYSVLDSIPVGTNPGILFVDSQNELNVVCTGDYFSTFGEVYRCDISDYSVIDSYEIGGSPSYESVSEEGIVYLGAGGWVDEGYVISYNSVSEAVLHSGSDPIILAGEPGIQGLTIDDEGYIYACAFNTDHLVKFDSDGNVIETFTVGDGPQTAIYVEYESTHVTMP